MPKYPHTGRVSPQSKSVLRKLKALSEASSFDLFTNHDSWTQQSLFGLRALLDKPEFASPKIKYDKFYNAGREAVVDRWDLQGWCDAQDSTEEDSDNTKLILRKRLKRKRCDETSINHDLITGPITPPPYEPPHSPHPHIPPALTPGVTASAGAYGPVSVCDKGKEPVTMLACGNQKEPIALPTLALVEHTATLVPAVVTDEEDTSDVDNSLLEFVLHSHSPLPALPIPVPASGVAPTCAPANTNVAQLTLENALSSSIGCRPMSSSEQHISRRCDDLLPSIENVDSPEIVAFPPSACQTAVCISCTPGPDAFSVSQVSDHSRDLLELSSSCIPETPTDISNRPRPSTNNRIRCIAIESLPHVMCLQKAAHWLTDLWRRWPYAHYNCITDLLKIGAAIRDLDADSYHIARARTLATLLEYHAKEQHNRSIMCLKEVETRRRFVENGVYELISWLDILHSEADMKFCDRLIKLALAREKTRQFIEDEAEGTERYHRLLSCFTNLKAKIVLDACIQFGEMVLDQDEHIAQKMLAEKRRVQL